MSSMGRDWSPVSVLAPSKGGRTTDPCPAEFAAEKHGYTATKHQHEVGTGYFDEISQIVSGGTSSTTALKGSTEAEQFH